MSFVIALYVREGIVLAGDSRLTLNTQQQQLGNITVNLAVGQTDSTHKVFLTPAGFGIATFGAADIAGVPISGFVESFLADVIGDRRETVHGIAVKLLEYFRQFTPIPATGFLVAGYTNVPQPQQEVWNVDVSQNQALKANVAGQQGATWGGEGDILTRLLSTVGILDSAGNLQDVLPTFPIPWQFFTLQDAIDFAVFAVRSTSDAIRFQTRPKTVGGPIDVLIIKPGRSSWVKRKELHVD